MKLLVDVEGIEIELKVTPKLEALVLQHISQQLSGIAAVVTDRPVRKYDNRLPKTKAKRAPEIAAVAEVTLGKRAELTGRILEWFKKNRGEHKGHEVAEALEEEGPRISGQLRKLATEGILEKVQFGVYKYIPPVSNLGEDMDVEEEEDKEEDEDSA